MPAPPVDLSHLSASEARAHMGELVELFLRRSGACVLIRRKTGEITAVDPAVLDLVPEAEMALFLLESWEEDEIISYLTAAAARRRKKFKGE